MKISKNYLNKVIAEELKVVLGKDLDEIGPSTPLVPKESEEFTTASVAAPPAPPPVTPAAATPAPAAPAPKPTPKPVAPAPKPTPKPVAPPNAATVNCVKNIQNLLIQSGLPIAKTKKTAPDGIYGPVTKSSVAQWFITKGLQIPSNEPCQIYAAMSKDGSSGGGGGKGSKSGQWTVISSKDLTTIIAAAIDDLDAPTTVEDIANCTQRLQTLDHKLIQPNLNNQTYFPAIFAFIERYESDQNFGESFDDALLNLQGNASLKGAIASGLTGAAAGSFIPGVGNVVGLGAGLLGGAIGNKLGQMRRGAEGVGALEELIQNYESLKQQGADWIQSNPKLVNSQAQNKYGKHVSTSNTVAPQATQQPMMGTNPEGTTTVTDMGISESLLRVNKKYLEQVILEETLKMKEYMKKFAKKE